MSAVLRTNVDEVSDVWIQKATNLCYRLHTPALFMYEAPNAWIGYKTNVDLTMAWRDPEAVSPSSNQANTHTLKNPQNQSKQTKKTPKPIHPPNKKQTKKTQTKTNKRTTPTNQAKKPKDTKRPNRKPPQNPKNPPQTKPKPQPHKKSHPRTPKSVLLTSISSCSIQYTLP